MKETVPPCSSGSSWRIPPAALTGLKSEKVLSRHYEEEHGLYRLFSCFQPFPSSLPPSLPNYPILFLTPFLLPLKSLLAFLSDSLSAFLWKEESPERAPKVSKVPGSNLELACLLPVPLVLETALGQEDPHSHHLRLSLAATAPGQVLHLWRPVTASEVDLQIAPWRKYSAAQMNSVCDDAVSRCQVREGDPSLLFPLWTLQALRAGTSWLATLQAACRVHRVRAHGNVIRATRDPASVASVLPHESFS